MGKYQQSLGAFDIKGDKTFQAHLKRKKSYGMVMFVSMNKVKKSVIQSSNVRAHHRKRSSVR